MTLYQFKTINSIFTQKSILCLEKCKKALACFLKWWQSVFFCPESACQFQAPHRNAMQTSKVMLRLRCSKLKISPGCSLQGSPCWLRRCPVLSIPTWIVNKTPPFQRGHECHVFLSLYRMWVCWCRGGRKMLICRIPPHPQSETDVPYDFECGTQDLGLVQAHSS